MNTYTLDNYEHAQIGDTVTNGYGETLTIIGETNRGTAWLTRSPRGLAGFLFKKEQLTNILEEVR